MVDADASNNVPAPFAALEARVAPSTTLFSATQFHRVADGCEVLVTRDYHMALDRNGVDAFDTGLSSWTGMPLDVTEITTSDAMSADVEGEEHYFGREAESSIVNDGNIAFPSAAQGGPRGRGRANGNRARGGGHYRRTGSKKGDSVRE
jgi:hypothetical protein